MLESWVLTLLLNYAHNLRFQVILIENKVVIWHKYSNIQHI